jgi:hypothetical protein
MKVGRVHYIVASVALLWVITVILSMNGTYNLQGLSSSAEQWSKIFTFIATIWGGMVAFNRSLLWGQPRRPKRMPNWRVTHGTKLSGGSLA